MKTSKILILCLIMNLIFLSKNAMSACDQTGDNSNNCWTCGDDCTARLDSNGKLTVSGSGAMVDYTHNGGGWSSAPWYSQKEYITSLDVQGISKTGNAAFAGLTKLTSANIGKSVETLGNGAFNRSRSLAQVTFEEGSQLKNLGGGSFYWTAISSLTLPEGVINIGQYAFHAMPNLTELTISDQTILPWNSLKNNPWGEPTVDFSKTTFKCAGVLETCKANLLAGGLQDGTFNLVQTSYKRKNEDGSISYYDANGSLISQYSYNPDGPVSIYDANGKLIGLQGKRILTVEEASALVKGDKNTFTLKYR